MYELIILHYKGCNFFKFLPPKNCLIQKRHSLLKPKNISIVSKQKKNIPSTQTPNPINQVSQVQLTSTQSCIEDWEMKVAPSKKKFETEVSVASAGLSLELVFIDHN